MPDDFEYKGVPMRIPSGDLTKPLDLPEGCWCAMALARADVLYRFAPDDEAASARFEILEATRLQCQGRPNPPMELALEVYSKMYGLGISIVREAVNQARADNPDLARRGGPPYGFPDTGRPGHAVVKEMQTLLNVLGFRPGPEDGRMGPITSEAIEGFQLIMGLPITGQFDATAVQLLRNCMFTLSDRPVTIGEYDPSEQRFGRP
jgi:hypothetical protein